MPVYQREQRLRALRELRARITREIAHLESEIQSGRRGQPIRPKVRRPAPPTSDAPASVIRAWARRQGIDVPTRGRVSIDLREQYAEAHGTR